MSEYNVLTAQYNQIYQEYQKLLTGQVELINLGNINVTKDYASQFINYPLFHSWNINSRPEDGLDFHESVKLNIGGNQLGLSGVMLSPVSLGNGENRIQPAIVRAGDVFFVPKSFKDKLTVGSNILGLNNLFYPFGRFPENLFAAAVSSIVSNRKWKEDEGVIDFGAGTGIQLVTALWKGAKVGMGIEYVQIGEGNQIEVDADLTTNNIGGRIKMLSQNLLGLNAKDCMNNWPSTVIKPKVAIVNIGPSYDNCEGDLDQSPHIKALELIGEIGSIEEVILGGFWESERYPHSQRLSQTHLNESHNLALEILNEYFDSIEVITLPQKMLCFIAKTRIKFNH